MYTLVLATRKWAGLAAAALALTTLVGITRSVAVDAAPGDTDSTFVPITPCRLADTRSEPNRVGPAGTLARDDTTTFQATGKNGECTIESDAVGLSLNVTALGASTAGDFLTFWPDGDRPLAASLNPAPGEPPTPNAVTTPLSAAGSFNVYNFTGTTDVVIDVVGYYTKSSLRELGQSVAAVEASTGTNTAGVATNVAAIAAIESAQDAGVSPAVLARLDALEADNIALRSAVATLESKTSAMSVVDAGATVRFSGVNVQVVDGSGDTGGVVNGRGNLIVGYNEDASTAEVRSGSHNLVVGDDNDYTSFGGVVFGSSNNITGEYATVTGGSVNTASGQSSSVSGGNENVASSRDASVSGGDSNEASGNQSSVHGGFNNDATGTRASISGGSTDTVSNTDGWDGGGGKIAALEAAQPFAVSARGNYESVTFADETVVSVSVVAPVAGHVTVTSTATGLENTASDVVRCSITSGTTLDPDHQQIFLDAGTTLAAGQLAGTRRFDIAAGATGTYNLVCNTINSSISSNAGVENSVLTAIFTPAP